MSKRASMNTRILAERLPARWVQLIERYSDMALEFGKSHSTEIEET